jgi:hypothetical protein
MGKTSLEIHFIGEEEHTCPTAWTALKNKTHGA